LRASASYAFWHDEEIGLHLQLEVSVLAISQVNSGVGPPSDIGEPALPYAIGLRAGWRRGIWTVRAALDGECCDLPPRAMPFLAGAAVFAGLGHEGRLGFVGLESLGDFARPNPFVLAPTVVVAFHQFPIPVRVGLGAPIFLGPTSSTNGFGAILKVMLESDR
jgi:hypothetical protein